MYRMSCSPSDFNTTTSECSNPVWLYTEGLLPALTVSDAFTLGSAVVAVWTLGFGFKILRKFVFR